MTHLWRAGLLLAAALTGPGAHAEDTSACPNPATQQEFPQVLGPGFLRQATHNFEPDLPGGGCSVRYKHPSGMWADVYIYRAGLGVIEDIPRDPRLMAEFQDTLSGIVQGWKQKRGGVVRDTEAKYAPRGKQGIEVLVGVAVIELPDGVTYRSHAQLWSGAGSFWKVRATYLNGDRAASDPAVEMLGSALADISREAKP